MKIKFHPHALDRMKERGVTRDEVIVVVKNGEKIPAKFSRTGFRRNFQYNKKWRGRYFNTKQVEVYAVKENSDWLVITVIAKYF